MGDARQIRGRLVAVRLAGVAVCLGLWGCGAGPPEQEAMTPPPAAVASPVTTMPSPEVPSTPVETEAGAGGPVLHTLEPWDHQPIAAEDLVASTHARWFFGHQSVGGNVLKGVNALYQSHDLDEPPQIDLKAGDSVPDTGGFVAHAHVGRNGHPMEKIADFDTILRGGVATRIDAALLKFCYADVRAGRVDIVEVLDEYRRVVSALEHDFPQVVFFHATVPLKADAPADNVLRTQLNAMIRAEYADTGRLWDIAAIESTTPEGEPVGGVHEGDPYQALHEGFTHDGGHLYERGTEVAAAPLLEMVAAAAP